MRNIGLGPILVVQGGVYLKQWCELHYVQICIFVKFNITNSFFFVNNKTNLNLEFLSLRVRLVCKI
jgi:hypothetical protein